MKKNLYIARVIFALLLAIPLPALAWHGGPRGDWGHGGYRGHGGYHDHGGHFGVELWLGPGWWGPPYRPYAPYYPYPYPYYSPPQVIVPQQPDVYIQQVPQTSRPEASDYWYYCQDPRGYYPYVQQCPGGWMKVVPTPPPGEKE